MKTNIYFINNFYIFLKKLFTFVLKYGIIILKKGGILMIDNIRDFFDRLGLEPDEKFKLTTVKKSLFSLSADLNGYVFTENGEGCKLVTDWWLLRELLVYPEHIIKLQKLPKRKKLRDFTPEDYKRWRCTNCARAILSCEECVFDCVNCNNNSKKCWVNNKDLYSDKFLDQELEVE